MRILGIAVAYGVLAAGVFSQTLNTLLEECKSLAGGKLCLSDLDLVLETVMAGLSVS